MSARHATPLGVLDGATTAWVDQAGTLIVGNRELQWWIGASDRWHRPAAEVAVRQELLDGAPVVQTSLRVPGGDARARFYAVVLDGGEWLVLDVHNDSRTPLAVAIVTRALDSADTGSPVAGRAGSPPPGARGAWRHDGAVLSHDDAVFCVAARAPDHLEHAADLDELAVRLDALHAALTPAAPAPTPDGGRGGAVAQVFAVAHSTGVRVLVALRPAPGRPPALPAAVADGEAVIRGWRRQLDAVCRVVSGDDHADRELFEHRWRLLLQRDACASQDISALAGWGHEEEAVRRLDLALSGLRPPLSADEAVALLVAAADVVTWASGAQRRRDLADLLGRPALELAGWATPGRRRLRRDAAAEARAAVVTWAAGRLFAPLEGDAPWRRPDPDGVDGSATLASLVGVRTSARVVGPGAGDAGGAHALALSARRRLLVEDDLPGKISVLPGWTTSWRGRPVEAHRLPTAAGLLSFALRWHGERPALLWQLDPEDGPSSHRWAGTIDCPALDPSFGSAAASGETLLQAPVASGATPRAPGMSP